MGVEEIVADGGLILALLIALAAGLASFLSPCVLPLIPGYLAYVSAVADAPTQGDSSPGSAGTSVATASAAVKTQPQKTQPARGRMVFGALLFVAGFTAIFISMLVLAGSVGVWLIEWESIITRVMGVIVIVMGLVFMGVFGGMQRTSRLKLKPRVGLAGAPLLGAVFAIGWTPCIGPTLAVVSSLALQGGSVGRATMLGLAYSIGLGLPFVLAAFGFGFMTQTMTFFKRHMRVVNLIGGGLLILIGILMVTGVWSTLMFSLQAVMASYGTFL